MIVIAHRGASAVAPENTRAAIREAVRAGAQMVELDVQMSRDARLVVFHDERLERATDGGGRVSRSRYAQLARLDAGSWFHPRFAGERILLVSQAIRLVPPPMRINLELKPAAHRAALVRRLVPMLRRLRVVSRVVLSSFEPSLLRLLRSTGWALALICRTEPERSLRRAVALGCRSWHPFHGVVTPRLIARAHDAGLRVCVWTVDDLRRARQMARWGVDGFFTNHPARFRHFGEQVMG